MQCTCLKIRTTNKDYEDPESLTRIRMLPALALIPKIGVIKSYKLITHLPQVIT